jgi:hypothetical protein
MYKAEVIKYFRKIMYYITESSIYKPIEHTNELVENVVDIVNCLLIIKKWVVGVITIWFSYSCYWIYKKNYIKTDFLDK